MSEALVSLVNIAFMTNFFIELVNFSYLSN
jgi:hypothetical protein